MDEKLDAIVKSLGSTGDLAVFSNTQIEALVSVLEHHHQDAFWDYQQKLYELLNEKIKSGQLPNPFSQSLESDS